MSLFNSLSPADAALRQAASCILIALNAGFVVYTTSFLWVLAFLTLVGLIVGETILAYRLAKLTLSVKGRLATEIITRKDLEAQVRDHSKELKCLEQALTNEISP